MERHYRAPEYKARLRTCWTCFSKKKILYYTSQNCNVIIHDYIEFSLEITTIHVHVVMSLYTETF